MQGLTRRDLLVQGATALVASQLVATRSSAAAGGISFDEYVKHDALGLAKLVADGEVSASDLLEAAIARAEAVNPELNAIVIPFYDRARAEVRKGLPAGPFQGVPWLLKDLHLKLKGTITSYGSVAWRDAVMTYDSTLVERYRAAGLVTFGKSASPEFGATATTESTLWGQTHNPWNLAHTPGGSSGGSAAAVAAGVLPAANASDGGGSIRIPASCCGLFGLKPTRGRVPVGPHRFGGAGLSVIHAVTRSVRDSAALLDISHGAAPYDPYAAPPVQRPYAEELKRDLPSLRVGFVKVPVSRSPVHPECEKAAANAAKLCEKLGHRVEEVTLPIDPREYYGAVQVNSTIGTARMIRAREAELGRPLREDEIEPLNWQDLAAAEKIDGAALAGARDTFHRVGEQMSELMAKSDVLLSPTMADPPVKLGVMSLSNPNEQEFVEAATAASAFTMLYNVSGQPAMSVPLHWTADGLPVGVMFAAAFGREDLLFRLGAQLEQAQPWFERRPAL